MTFRNILLGIAILFTPIAHAEDVSMSCEDEGVILFTVVFDEVAGTAGIGLIGDEITEYHRATFTDTDISWNSTSAGGGEYFLYTLDRKTGTLTVADATSDRTINTLQCSIIDSHPKVG